MKSKQKESSTPSNCKDNGKGRGKEHKPWQGQPVVGEVAEPLGPLLSCACSSSALPAGRRVARGLPRDIGTEFGLKTSWVKERAAVGI